jgi:hypothetical protein
MTASGFASTGWCARSGRWRGGAAPRDGFIAKPPDPVKDRLSWNWHQTFVFSVADLAPTDHCSPIVALTTSGSIFHSTMTNHDAKRTAIHTTGANCAWLRRGRFGRLGSGLCDLSITVL